MTASQGLFGARILVTGPTGFLGSHSLRRLLSEAGEIHAVNRQGTGGPISDRIFWHAADLRDASQATALIACVRPSHLLHGAWIATPGVYSDSPDNLTWLQAGVALVRSFGEYGGTRFVGVGSSAEYGVTDYPCREDETSIRPASVYGACKAALWLAARAAAMRYGFSAAWGRVFLLYGPGDPVERLLPTVLAGLAAGRTVNTGIGSQVRDFIHAADAADLLIGLLASAEPGAFNVGTGRGTPVRYAIDYLADRMRAKTLLRPSTIERSLSEPGTLVADLEKVRARLGWTAPTTLENGLDMLLASPGFGIAVSNPGRTRDDNTDRADGFLRPIR